MFKIGNKIEIKIMDVIGEVIEIDKSSVLIKHTIEDDGQNKIVNQWYDLGICTEVEFKSK